MSGKIKRKITKPYTYTFQLEQPGLVAIFVSARCKSKQQLQSNVDEDLRIEINRAPFRELPPEKNIQQFNIPCTFNGSQLRGLKKTVVFLTVLAKGKHAVTLMPRHSAFVEEVRVQSLAGNQGPAIAINEQAEDGDRRPWYSFVLIDLPLRSINVKASIQYRWPDSDDAKLIVGGHAREQDESVLHAFWVFAGSLLKKIFKTSATTEKTFETSLLPGTHYVELYADKTPTLHSVRLDVSESETKAQERARHIIKENAGIIKTAAREFDVDPVIVAGVIYQEQSTNVNFADTLSDYIGGLLYANTSIGIGQVRVNTARALEEQYPSLNPTAAGKEGAPHNTIRVEFLKDPLMNVRYVAAKIAFDQERWKAAGFDISDQPEILGTLYNISSIEKPHEPHAEPDSNDFGKGVAENYGTVKRLLGI